MGGYVLGMERLPTKRMRGVRALQRAMVTRIVVMKARLEVESISGVCEIEWVRLYPNRPGTRLIFGEMGILVKVSV